MTRWLLIAALLAPLSAAWAGELPDSARELLPEHFDLPAEGTTAADSAWWTTLGGEELTALLQQSGTVTAVQTAAQSVSQAQGRSTQAAANWLPSLTASGNWSTGTSSAAFAAAGQSSNLGQASASLDLNVPLTPWSSVPNQRAADADVRGARADEQSAAIQATVDLTGLWLDVVFAYEQLDLVQEQLATDEALLTLVEARYATGDSTGADVLQQRQQVASTRGGLPEAEAAVGLAERALASALRLPSSRLPSVTTRALPDVPRALPLAEPEQWVTEHPDVQSALASYEAASLRTDAARAEYLPSLSATASTGYRVVSGSTTKQSTPTWSVGLSLSVPLFDGGRTVGSTQESAAAERSALLTLEQTTLDVSQQLSDALALEAQRRAEVLTSAQTAQLAADALQASRAEYARGISTYNTVLSAVATARTAERNELTARRNHLSAALDLIALSGSVWLPTLEAA